MTFMNFSVAYFGIVQFSKDGKIKVQWSLVHIVTAQGTTVQYSDERDWF